MGKLLRRTEGAAADGVSPPSADKERRDSDGQGIAPDASITLAAATKRQCIQGEHVCFDVSVQHALEPLLSFSISARFAADSGTRFGCTTSVHRTYTG